MPGWTTADIPNQTGRVAVVTGATGGLGLETGLALAAAGATVILAGRNVAKGEAAVALVKHCRPDAAVTFTHLDLADLRSVARCATETAARYPSIDLLIDNAGVMAVPHRHETIDGFELQFGSNYLGHFALTGRLLPALRRGRNPRLVTLSSLAHLRGRIDFADPQATRRYGAWTAYNQSKLAMLMFAIEFQRRSAALGWGVRAVAAHPGWANTDILRNGPALGRAPGLKERIAKLAFPLFGQSGAAGALPILYAATATDAQAGGYYGPDGFYELRGAPHAAHIAPQARDVDAAAKLWDLSVHLTGVDPAKASAAT